jgi:glycosyltransferase involved in cell wall biosynthesis
MPKPYFSVIICTFNRKALIGRAINSLLSQKENEWEAIIIDDGSVDKSFEVIEPLIRDNHKFNYVYHSHQGVSKSRNLGINIAQGSFVTFLDSDDEYAPNHLSKRKKVLTSNPDIEILHGGFEIIGNPYVPDITQPGKMVHLSECVVGGTFFIKVSVFVNIGVFPDVSFGEDFHFFNKALQNGVKIAKIEDKTYIYHRDNEDSICNQMMDLDRLRLD